MPVSKRILKPLVQDGKVSGYDDPRLPTLEAMHRRGIVPEAIRKFVLSLGFTKSDTLAPFDTLESFNRKIIDVTSIRLFMVTEPVKITIKNNKLTQVELPNHPQRSEMGKRHVEIDGNFYISGDDAKTLKAGDQVRLIELYNVKITKAGSEIEAEYLDNDFRAELPKIQWIPQKNATKLNILIPKTLFVNEKFNEDSLETLQAYTENHYLELNEGAEIQFVRFGYCRKDSAMQAIYTHK
jgi:glutamyl-tRNA synthetase